MRYKLVKSDDEDNSTNKLASRSKKITSCRVRPIIMIIFFGILFLCYLAIADNLKPGNIGSSAIDSLARSLNLHKPFYIVIIDAGSTGSRLLVFTFHSSIFNADLILDHEYFVETKPGLSYYANNPKEGVETLKKLVNQAKKIIPKSAWANTPISMKATAGLRLLPKDKANALIDECTKYLSNSGFFVMKNSVSIMEGVDEGIFAWFTVNFLIGHLSSHNCDNTVATLDLGGGSTQITYVPDDENHQTLDKHIYNINAFNNNMSIYTYSHLGMGLMAARKAILTYNMDLEHSDKRDVIQVRSECINPIISNEWHYNGVDYLVKGPVNGSHKVVKTLNYAGADEDRPIVRFLECVKIIKNYTDNIKEKPVGLSKHEIYLVSYYYDRAIETGLIDPFAGGVITLEDFHRSAKEVCNYPNTDQPFMCLDLTYIYVLLHDSFGLESSTKLNIYKKYNGHELSWALGYAFSLANND